MATDRVDLTILKYDCLICIHNGTQLMRDDDYRRIRFFSNSINDIPERLLRLRVEATCRLI